MAATCEWQIRDELRAEKHFNHFDDKTITVVLEHCLEIVAFTLLVSWFLGTCKLFIIFYICISLCYHDLPLPKDVESPEQGIIS